jgi:hypothetical protein
MPTKTFIALFIFWTAAVTGQARIQTVNLMERGHYPTLQSVCTAFRSTQQPDVMFLGVTARFKEASLDQIAEGGLDLFETRSVNLSGLINQVLALGNLTARVLNGETVRPENRERLHLELATVGDLKRTLYVFLQNVPNQNRILVNYRGSSRDIRMQIERIELDCAAAVSAGRS